MPETAEQACIPGIQPPHSEDAATFILLIFEITHGMLMVFIGVSPARFGFACEVPGSDTPLHLGAEAQLLRPLDFCSASCYFEIREALPMAGMQSSRVTCAGAAGIFFYNGLSAATSTHRRGGSSCR